MTSELIQAAERLRLYLTSHEAGDPRENPYLDGESHDIFQDVEQVVDNVLATVRADDEIVISPEWLDSVGFRTAAKIGTHEILDVSGRFSVDAQHGQTWLNQGSLVHVKTRGDLRQLCRALKIELREQ